ncbi:MAG: GHKL domain-containing protein [Lachnospiraceae bacterium]|nr:GHKL domain-containing protein [Lachnospiraceae bacterium]
MAERFYLVFEILAVLLCLHGLYGQKFKWNIYTLLFMGIELASYQIEYICSRPMKYWEIVLYLLLFLYSKVQFKESWRDSLINYILCMVSTAVLQMICYLPMVFWYPKLAGIINQLVNTLLLCVVFALYKLKVWKAISAYMRQRGKMVTAFLIAAVLFLVVSMYRFEAYKELQQWDYFILIVSIVLLFAFLLSLQKERLLNKQLEAEKNLNSLYSGAVIELIEQVRVNQHNYRNQLTAIQGMVYTAGSLEELKAEQEKYCNDMMQDDIYAQIISGNGDPVIAGFLYLKLCSKEVKGVEKSCVLHIGKLKDSLFEADVVKILGVLIDNAIEEVKQDRYIDKKIEIEIAEENELIINVGNVCRFIKSEEVVRFFEKGTSGKGDERGLGLYSVKNIVRKRHGQIYTDNRERNGQNWFYITVRLPLH